MVSLCSNLGILVFFKYTDFFTQDVLCPAQHALTGDECGIGRLNLILPAGISFHTFQSLSYTIDVYRRELPATRSVVQFATFVLFFPQLVAGPIVRAQELLPQLAAPPPLELDRANLGMSWIGVGLFKKIALADTLAISIVDRVFEAPERYSSVEVLGGVYGYALQIYLDFSAYSDIAIGSAMILGFTLPENFRTPYRSVNLQEFWRRWHISLSTWLRDYLYVTLGGNRGSPVRTYVNLIATMILGGLWHGASWAFIVWGGLHGFGLAITRYFQRATEHAARRFAAWCALWFAGGALLLRYALPALGPWPSLVLGWAVTAPLWAVLTACSVTCHRRGEIRRPWSRRRRCPPARAPLTALRLAMCAAGVGFLAALQLAPTWTWIPLVLLTWGLALAADVLERGTADLEVRAVLMVRRAAAAVLVFHYVCFAWIFFRASSFANAHAVLDQIARWETDHPNLVPIVTTALAAGFARHFFAEGSFRWLRDRFVAMPAPRPGRAARRHRARATRAQPSEDRAVHLLPVLNGVASARSPAGFARVREARPRCAAGERASVALVHPAGFARVEGGSSSPRCGRARSVAPRSPRGVRSVPGGSSSLRCGRARSVAPRSHRGRVRGAVHHRRRVREAGGQLGQFRSSRRRRSPGARRPRSCSRRTRLVLARRHHLLPRLDADGAATTALDGAPACGGCEGEGCGLDEPPQAARQRVRERPRPEMKLRMAELYPAAPAQAGGREPQVRSLAPRLRALPISRAGAVLRRKAVEPYSQTAAARTQPWCPEA